MLRSLKKAGFLFFLILYAEISVAETLEPLSLVSRANTIALVVEIADTPQARARGLMERTKLPEKQGMLFIMPNESDLGMWMKNTPLPLDMLFIDRSGTIVKIATATPHSTDVIRADAPVISVLEIGGGLAKKWGIAAGDKVRHRAFK
jgi:uncharacterized membrane protein (UPF0127 family)